MDHPTRWLAVCGVAVVLTLSGCGGGAHAHDTDQDHPNHGRVDEDADHDHADHDHADHDDAGQNASADHPATIAPRELGSVDVEGIVLVVDLVESLAPGGAAHLDIARTAGPAPAALRVWIGDESGANAMRSRADGHDDHYHAHVESPAQLGPDTAVWLEAELPDGTRHRGSVALPLD